jgi:hypothetical protein
VVLESYQERTFILGILTVGTGKKIVGRIRQLQPQSPPGWKQDLTADPFPVPKLSTSPPELNVVLMLSYHLSYLSADKLVKIKVVG